MSEKDTRLRLRSCSQTLTSTTESLVQLSSGLSLARTTRHHCSSLASSPSTTQDHQPTRATTHTRWDPYTTERSTEEARRQAGRTSSGPHSSDHSPWSWEKSRTIPTCRSFLSPTSSEKRTRPLSYRESTYARSEHGVTSTNGRNATKDRRRQGRTSSTSSSLIHTSFSRSSEGNSFCRKCWKPARESFLNTTDAPSSEIRLYAESNTTIWPSDFSHTR